MTIRSGSSISWISRQSSVTRNRRGGKDRLGPAGAAGGRGKHRLRAAPLSPPFGFGSDPAARDLILQRRRTAGRALQQAEAAGQAAKETAAEDDAAADSGGDGEKHHIAASPGAADELAPRGRLGVVDGQNRLAEHGLCALDQGVPVGNGQRGGVERRPAAVANDAGRRDADLGIALAERQGPFGKPAQPTVWTSIAVRRDHRLMPQDAVGHQADLHLGAADVDRQRRFGGFPGAAERALDCGTEPGRRMFGPGDGRSYHHGESSGRDRFGRLGRGADSSFGNHVGRQRPQGADQCEIGSLGLRPADIAGERGAEIIDACRERTAPVVGRSAVGHRPAPAGAHRSNELRDARRTWALRGVEGNHIGAGFAERLDVRGVGGDAHRAVGEIALDQPDDRHADRLADRLNIGGGFDAHRLGACPDRRLREPDDEGSCIHRPARDRLAGHDQAVLKLLARHQGSPLAPDPSR